MKHVSKITRRLPAVAGDTFTKECTPMKENAGKCEDV
jgi:hypothetical protein